MKLQLYMDTKLNGRVFFDVLYPNKKHNSKGTLIQVNSPGFADALLLNKAEATEFVELLNFATEKLIQD